METREVLIVVRCGNGNMKGKWDGNILIGLAHPFYLISQQKRKDVNNLRIKGQRRQKDAVTATLLILSSWQKSQQSWYLLYIQEKAKEVRESFNKANWTWKMKKNRTIKSIWSMWAYTRHQTPVYHNLNFLDFQWLCVSGVHGWKTVSEKKGDKLSCQFTKLLTTSNPEGNPSLIVINSDNRTARGKIRILV